MIKLNNRVVEIGKFPDGTILFKEDFAGDEAVIKWMFENNEELVSLIYITRHLSTRCKSIRLIMPYIPNARQDRVKSAEDVFTLKHFAWVINNLGFSEVRVLDPHSSVSEALIDNIKVIMPSKYIERAFNTVSSELGHEPMMFYPDEGAMKRYSGMFTRPYLFGIKQRDWETGKIHGLSVAGLDPNRVAGSDVIIIDDICSKGGTFLHSAKKLKELGANKIFLYVTHCENTIFDGELLTSGLIEKVFTTDSIFNSNHKMIEVFETEGM